MIDRLAAERPKQTALIFVDGPQWSFAELRETVRRRAAGLQRLGVRQDAFVLSWQPNGPDAALTFLALNYLGAVYVPINIAYRGGVLQHVIENSGATLMIAHSALVERLATVGRGALKRVVVTGEMTAAPDGLELIGPQALSGPAETVTAPERSLRPWDTHMVIYTSGTTGPSKGVLSSYRHSYTAAREFRNIGPGDRNLTALPMHHVGGVYGLLWALIHGGSVVMAEAFRTGEFWSIVRRHDVTTTGLLGAMTRFLLAQPPSPDDRRHTLKSVVIAPYDEAAAAFSERFGVDVYTEFNMTELSVPLFAGPGPLRPGSCGKARPGVELRLVDEHDIEAAEGASGELVVRTDTPWTISHGYHNDPAATAAAWRNGWFHTGDLFRRDADGNYYFLDRTKDALRRRGENISSFEVESAIMLHPAVGEAAVVAARGVDGEDEVMAVIVPKNGAELEPAELFSFLRTRLAHFMLPRYLRFVPDLPRTPTHKVEKHRLRAEGVTSDTWDREAAGITIRRERLELR
jgi:crotonobetaine/carnitine-CoA ligase